MATTNNEGGTSNRGFASMDEQRRREIAAQGGRSQGRDNNPGNFANDPERASKAGRKGGHASSAHRSENESEEE